VRIVVINHVTLDGVMQAPGRPDEDTRDGFEHGGWAAKSSDDPDIRRAIGEQMAESGGLLLGRRTYEDLLSYWNAQTDSEFAEPLNRAAKYVASRTLREPLAWPNSTLLEGDAANAVAKLKATPGKDLQILGSGALIQSLIARDLIDEYTLMIYPLVLGSGRRLFPDGAFSPLRLVDGATTTTTGVIIAKYQPVR
jgi:dihydrofolate reductase